MSKNHPPGAVGKHPALHGHRLSSRIQAFSGFKPHQRAGTGFSPTCSRLGGVRNLPRRPKKLMLDGRRPTKIFRVPTETINLILVEYQHTPGGGILAGLIISIVPTRKILSKDPVSPVEIRVIEESHGSKKMSPLTLLGSTLCGCIPRNRTHLKAVPGLLVDFLGTKIRVLAITAENIRKPNLHLESLKPILDIITSFRITMIHQALH